MIDFLKHFDGSKRQPRQVQVDVLRWLAANWNASNVFAMQLPTGSGKSAIAEAVKRATGGSVIVPSNVLLDQYLSTYKSNYVKGKTHYSCHNFEGLSCKDVDDFELKCEGCDYRCSKQKAIEKTPTFFNPISYFYLRHNKAFRPPKVLIIDEAHLLKEMMLLLCGCSFRRGYYGYPDFKDDVAVIEWMKVQADKLGALKKQAFERKDTDLLKRTDQELEKLSATLEGITDEPQNYVIYREERPYRDKTDEYLIVAPIEPPKFIKDRILAADKVILMSATLPKTDVMGLARGAPFLYYDAPSPIPKDQRQVLFRPAPHKMSWETTPKEVADWIKGQLAEFLGRNTIVHVTYAQSAKLKAYFPGALTNTPETKDAVLAKFKKEGGLWLASGCSEGIDLPGDECRLNLIPMLTRLNPVDPVVKKRMALQYGRLWYDMETIKTVIQQAGRSTRGLDDHSITIIGDPAFGQLILRNKQHVPKSFMESIVWRKNKAG